MEYTQRILYQSNYWYNDGLKRAKIRDLSGAVASLKKSLQFNRGNIAARNLLGLVYYGRGEIGEALVEWIISKNLKSHENIANYYIKKLQDSPAELEAINQAIQKYNQSLQFCQQNGEDLAIIQLKKAVSVHPSFLKAYQLLTLLYIKTEQYSKAKQVIKIAHKLDTTNETTLRYMHELQTMKKGTVKKVAAEDDGQTVTYSIGNETIIQPAVISARDHRNRFTVTNLLLGVLLGVLVMWFLVIPAVNRSSNKKMNDQAIEFSDKIATQEAQISALKKELESYRATSEETESAQQTAESTLNSYEIVLNMYTHFVNEDMSDAAMVKELINVNPESLGTLGKERYDTITETVYGRYCNVLYTNALGNYEIEYYEEVITDLTLLMQIDAGYDDGEAMYLLAKTYEAIGDKENAAVWLGKVQKNYPGVMQEETTSTTSEENE